MPVPFSVMPGLGPAIHAFGPTLSSFVIPAKAGIQSGLSARRGAGPWTPACLPLRSEAEGGAGVTESGRSTLGRRPREKGIRLAGQAVEDQAQPFVDGGVKRGQPAGRIEGEVEGEG